MAATGRVGDGISLLGNGQLPVFRAGWLAEVNWGFDCLLDRSHGICWKQLSKPLFTTHVLPVMWPYYSKVQKVTMFVVGGLKTVWLVIPKHIRGSAGWKSMFVIGTLFCVVGNGFSASYTVFRSENQQTQKSLPNPWTSPSLDAADSPLHPTKLPYAFHPWSQFFSVQLMNYGCLEWMALRTLGQPKAPWMCIPIPQDQCHQFHLQESCINRFHVQMFWLFFVGLKLFRKNTASYPRCYDGNVYINELSDWDSSAVSNLESERMGDKDETIVKLKQVHVYVYVTKMHIVGLYPCVGDCVMNTRDSRCDSIWTPF